MVYASASGGLEKRCCAEKPYVTQSPVSYSRQSARPQFGGDRPEDSGYVLNGRLFLSGMVFPSCYNGSASQRWFALCTARV